MGGSSSKPVRKLPKGRPTPPWAGARTPPPGPSARPLASETKNEAIGQDAMDPQFMSNLNRLGPVRVDHHMETIKTAEGTKRIFQSRAQSEDEASASEPTRNRLPGPNLSDLLNERKAARSRQDLQRLAQKYGMDLEKLESLSRFVSSPSVVAGSTTTTIGKDGDESVTATTVWIEPRLT